MEPYFSMDEEQWQYAQDNFSKEEIKESLVEILMEYEPPYMEISEKECLDEYRKLKGIKWNDLRVEGEWFPREGPSYTYSLELNNKKIYFKRLNVGNKASNFFQQQNRWSAEASAYPGPLRTWNTEKFMYTLLGALFSLKVSKVNRSVLRTCISLRKYICSQFKPCVAKAIYDKYKCKNVLDFSAGWGDRLAGFYASDYGELYVGIDPKKENPSIYRQQTEFYEKHRTLFEGERKCEFINEPAEDADLSKYEGMMDIVFTSPPYFNVERYSTDDTQSWVRHKDIDGWNKLFLHKAIDNVWKTLKSGGLLMVNISDVYSNEKWSTERCWQEICNPMNNFLSTFNNSEYQGCFGMEMARRPNCKGIGTAKDVEVVEKESDIFAEPVWVWKKK